MRKKLWLIAIILIITIGYALVSASLAMTGFSYVSKSIENMNVIFTDYDVTNGSAYFYQGGIGIEFITGNLDEIGEISKLEYKISNLSTIYDVDTSVELEYEENIDSKLLDYIEITKKEEWEGILKSRQYSTGSITIKLKKAYDDFVKKKSNIKLHIYINANAIEKDNINNNPAIKWYPNDNLLFNIIANNALGSDEENKINYTNVSSGTNGSGIYMLNETSDDEKPIFFYRGDVSNNNLVFANYCWKIVRTTETGGIKIIYNGVPNAGKCNNTGTASQISSSVYASGLNDNAYVGYMYGKTGAKKYDDTHANTTNSSVKNSIESWFSSNMNDYVNQLEDTIFCNNRLITSGNGYAKNSTVYASKNNLIDSAERIVSLECPQDNDKFTKSAEIGNGKLSYPVGLLTFDEMAFAGAVSYANNINFYLYTGNAYWSMSPLKTDKYLAVSAKSYVGIMNENGQLSDSETNVERGIRPVVSLKNNVRITGGNGSSTNPYVI